MPHVLSYALEPTILPASGAITAMVGLVLVRLSLSAIASDVVLRMYSMCRCVRKSWQPTVDDRRESWQPVDC